MRNHLIERFEKLSLATHNQDNNNGAAGEEDLPEFFGFLDDLPIARAVLVASEEPTLSRVAKVSLQHYRGLDGGHREQQRPTSIETFSRYLWIPQALRPQH